MTVVKIDDQELNLLVTTQTQFVGGFSDKSDTCQVKNKIKSLDSNDADRGIRAFDQFDSDSKSLIDKSYKIHGTGHDL